MLVLLLSHYEKKKQIHDKLKKAAFFCMLFHITQQKSFFQHFLENFFLTKNLRFLIPPPQHTLWKFNVCPQIKNIFFTFYKEAKKIQRGGFWITKRPTRLAWGIRKNFGTKNVPQKEIWNKKRPREKTLGNEASHPKIIHQNILRYYFL